MYRARYLRWGARDVRAQPLPHRRCGDGQAALPALDHEKGSGRLAIRERNGDQARAAAQPQRQLRHDADAEPVLDQPGHGPELGDFESAVANLHGTEHGLRLLPYAAAAYRVDELLPSQVFQPGLFKARHRMIAAAQQEQALVEQVQRFELQLVAGLRVQPQVHFATRNQVQAAIGHDVVQTQGDARIVLAELRQLLGQPGRGGRGGRGDRHPADTPARAIAQLIRCRTDLGGNAAGPLREDLAFGRQRDIARVAVEQAGADLLFQAADHLAESRWRHVAALGRHGKTPRFLQRQEGIDQATRKIH